MVATLAGCSSKSGGDWTAKKLVTTEVTLDGVTFTIDVPEGLPKDGRNPGHWSDAKVESDHDPKVFTSVDEAERYKTIEDALRWDKSEKSNWLRKETRADGFALTDVGKDKHRIAALTFRKAGTKMIKCNAVQVGDGEVPNYDATRAMLEKICDSVKPK